MGLAGNNVDLETIIGMVEKGTFRTVVDKSFGFSLSEVKSAFAYLMAGHASGKVVINLK